MPNDYSIEIHKYLTEKIAENERLLKQRSEKSPFYEGQLYELRWLRQYLAEHIDLKDFTYY
ncbi:MAG: hypothetical protein ACWGOX_10400 [Desulforhopalus sp.]